MNDALVGGAFDLIDQGGHRVRSADLLGRHLLLYFGFTHCKIICPRALRRLSDALDQLDVLAPLIQPLFITVDPERDTPAALRLFLSASYPRFLGLTGRREQIEAVRSAYKVFARRYSDPTEPDGYSVSHSAFSYVVDAAGLYCDHFTDAADADRVAECLRARLSPPACSQSSSIGGA
jgi:protein SCO1/2